MYDLKYAQVFVDHIKMAKNLGWDKCWSLKGVICFKNTRMQIIIIITKCLFRKSFWLFVKGQCFPKNQFWI